MKFLIEIEQEVDGRWTPEEAKLRVQALALRVIADRIESPSTNRLDDQTPSGFPPHAI